MKWKHKSHIDSTEYSTYWSTEYNTDSLNWMQTILAFVHLMTYQAFRFENWFVDVILCFILSGMNDISLNFTIWTSELLAFPWKTEQWKKRKKTNKGSEHWKQMTYIRWYSNLHNVQFRFSINFLQFIIAICQPGRSYARTEKKSKSIPMKNFLFHYPFSDWLPVWCMWYIVKECFISHLFSCPCHFCRIFSQSAISWSYYRFHFCIPKKLFCAGKHFFFSRNSRITNVSE